MSLRDDILGKILEKTNAAPKEVEWAFELANHNIENAIELLKSKVIIIKGKIIAEYEDLFGIFLIKIFLDSYFIKPLFCFSRDYHITQIDITQKWRELEKNINDRLAFIDKYIFYINEKLNQKIVNSSKIFEYLKNANVEEIITDNKIEHIVYDEIYTEFSNAQLFIDIVKKTISRVEYEWILKEETLKEKKDIKEQKDFEDKDLFIKSEFVILENNDKLKKNKYKKVEELAIGEEVLIKIIPSNIQTSYIYNILKLDKSRMRYNILAAKIINIDKSEKDARVIILEILPGIFSKIRATNSTLIKINENLTSFKKFSIIFLIILIFVLAVALYFIFFIRLRYW